MPTIRECLQRLMPKGTNPDQSDHSRVPLWPPDLFAVVASLARASECYTLAAVRGGMGLGIDHIRECCQIGANWSELEPSVEEWLQPRWDRILARADDPVSVLRDYVVAKDLVTALFELLAVADEASAGVGFGGVSAIAEAAQVVMEDNEGITLCRYVTEDEVCVQPKGRTPGVGCNLRSMSQHLALVPSTFQVLTTHFEAREPFDNVGDATIGVLLVPFPYRVADDDFRAHRDRVPSQPWARLELGCSWHRTPIDELIRFVVEMISAAQRRGHNTDVVVLPELALTRAMWDRLVSEVPGPRLFVAGVLEEQPGGSPPKNLACGFFREATPLKWEQAKHHRWRIERFQVSNYGLSALVPDGYAGGGLNDPAWSRWYGWWEDIDIKDRRVVTSQFHRGATVATLICEDLSRVDPVQPVLRELGPTWLIALLMDGPQYPHRWSAQGAGAFADDPGSSVLVLTSLALIQRHRDNREGRKGMSHATIGLWRDPEGSAQPLELPASAHGLHLCLSAEKQMELTLDGRNDGGEAVVLRLKKQTAVTVEQAPTWARMFEPS